MTKGYPRVRFDIIDQTNIQEIPQITASTPIPLAMAAYTSDKGPEEWRVLYNLQQLTDTTGSISFVKHGQAQLTVAEELRNGAAVLCKRMVSDNATLANVTIRARVVKSNNVSYVYYYTTSGVNVGSFNDACTVGYNDFDPTATPVDVPLFTVTPMGRGTSNLFFRINPEYVSSKSSTFIRYSFEVYENQELLESIVFTMNPDIIIDGVSQALNPKIKANSQQIKVNMYDDGFRAFIYALAETAVVDENATTTIPVSELVNMDFLNGLDRRGATPIGGIVTKAASTAASDLWTTNKPSTITTVCDLGDAAGIPLTNGSYGSIGASPMDNPTEYERMLLGTFGANTSSGLFDPIIYDLDAYKIDFLCDCAYPASVKTAIINMIDFRGDMVFFADLGLTPNNITTIRAAVANIPYSRFCAVYHNHFNVYDPYTARQIHVTMPYLLAPKIINHIITGVGRPFAGILNSITFPEIIENTINFLPIEIPGSNQKQDLVDMNINYISYYEGTPVMETMYTNVDDYTQLSFVSNIMAVQEVIKAIRTNCPKVRYTFMDGTDLQNYIDDTTRIINQYSTNFRSISMQYMADEKYESNNIFYATIVVQFKNFIQEEYFRVIAIS